jgi:hypothetical protein
MYRALNSPAKVPYPSDSTRRGTLRHDHTTRCNMAQRTRTTRGSKPAPCSFRKVATRCCRGLGRMRWRPPSPGCFMSACSPCFTPPHLRGPRRADSSCSGGNKARIDNNFSGASIQAEARAARTTGCVAAQKFGRTAASCWCSSCIFTMARRFNLADYVRVATLVFGIGPRSTLFVRSPKPCARGKSKSAAACTSQSSEQKAP